MVKPPWSYSIIYPSPIKFGTFSIWLGNNKHELLHNRLHKRGCCLPFPPYSYVSLCFMVCISDYQPSLHSMKVPLGINIFNSYVLVQTYANLQELGTQPYLRITVKTCWRPYKKQCQGRISSKTIPNYHIHSAFYHVLCLNNTWTEKLWQENIAMALVLCKKLTSSFR